ncbi:hypothetical protein AURDEDRAFT_169350 [Auricularia subglabra TFB-10046 SS5]|nr:hypothetical protein AURDEDRAFT_169350 [Auricularia subglabra TFB-10046 SS5]
MSGTSTGSGPSLTIRLTEAVVFLRGGIDLNSTKWHAVPNAPPALLRGLLVFRVDKPVKVTSIEVELDGRTRTEWPEGIGARRIDITEERHILSAKTVFFEAPSSARRNVSLGPGVTLEGHHHFDDSTETVANDADDSDSDHHRRGRQQRQDTENDNDSDTHRAPPRSHSFDNGYFERGRANPVTHEEPRALSPMRSDDDHEHTMLSPLVASATASPIMSPTAELDGSTEDVRRRDAHRLSSQLNGSRPSISSHESTSRQQLPLQAQARASTHDLPPAYTPPSDPPSEGSRRRRASSSRSPVRAPSIVSSADAESMRPAHSRRFSLGQMMPWKRGDHSSGTLLQVESARPSISSPPPVAEIPSRERGRTREKKSTWNKIAHTLKLDSKGKEKAKSSAQNGWQEFKKGTYTFPISFAIPASTPPTIHCQYGSTTYRLKAYVHRQGAFTPKIVAVREVVLIASPGDEELGDVTDTVGSSLGVGSHVHIERQWETQMRYLIVVGGRGAPIGGRLPIWMTLMPLAGIRIYRITVALEERVDYYAHRRQVVRHDPVRRWELLSLKHDDKDHPTWRLLPVDIEQFDSPLDALAASPLFPYICSDPYAASAAANGKAASSSSATEVQRDDALVNMLSPDGPWMLHAELTIPQPCGRIHFTNRHPKSNLGVSHALKIIIRTERGDDHEMDPRTGRRKQFDIVVQTPLHILSCRCNHDWTSLPTYSLHAPTDAVPGPLSCVCARNNMPPTAYTSHGGTVAVPPAFNTHPMPYSGVYAHAHRAGAGGAAYLHHTALPDPGMSNPDMEGEGGPNPGDALPEHSRKFERLISGLESPAGEQPPRYDTF